jgi:hypothetical protein
MVMEVVAGCAIDTRKKLTENLLLAGAKNATFCAIYI